jgi:hypothetical protein
MLVIGGLGIGPWSRRHPSDEDAPSSKPSDYYCYLVPKVVYGLSTLKVAAGTIALLATKRLPSL